MDTRENSRKIARSGAPDRAYRRIMSGQTAQTELSYIAGLTRVRVAAGAVFTDDHDRVLVVFPTYKPTGELPGGGVERDESPRAACRRELVEGLGFAPQLGDLPCVAWVPPKPPWDGGLMFLFDGGHLTPEQVRLIRLPADELSRFEFIAADDLDDILKRRLARRVRACLARRGRGAAYPGNGTDGR